MKDTEKMICPICAEELRQPAFFCRNCGSDLSDVPPARPNPKTNPYGIVPDGSKFAITLGGEIKIHGLDFQSAQSLASILNSVIEDDPAFT